MQLIPKLTALPDLRAAPPRFAPESLHTPPKSLCEAPDETKVVATRLEGFQVKNHFGSIPSPLAGLQLNWEGKYKAHVSIASQSGKTAKKYCKQQAEVH